jgi:hypothetical protein
MPRSKKAVFDGRHYIWNGRQWFDRDTFLVPTTVICAKLNALLALKGIKAQDKKRAKKDTLLRTAKEAQQQARIARALQLAYQVHNQKPHHVETATMLCNALRTANKPKQAEALASNFRTSTYSPLLLSRAAALCDLQRWDDALKQVRQIFAMRVKFKKNGRSEEALAIYSRIKQNAPSLFK